MRQANIGLGARRVLVALCAALLALVALAPGAASAAPKQSISDIVGPSIIFIRTIYKGYVQVPLKTGTVWTPEMSLTTTCTGYAVDTKGSIATAGHCVNGKGDDIVDAFRQKSIELLQSEYNWTDAEATANYKIATADKWPVSGSTADSTASPTRSVAVQQPSGNGQVLTDWVDAEVVDFQQFDDGDNALLRINNQNLVPLAISTDVPQPGEAITAVGFPGAVRVVTDTSRIPQPSYKTGTVSSRQNTNNGVTKTEISAGMGHGMSGGPTVDTDGNVIGTNSSVSTDNAASFDFITDNIALRSYLESHGVQLAAPRGDSSGSGTGNMWLWLGPLIAVVVLVVLVLAIVSIRRSRKRKAQNNIGYPGPGGPGQFGPGQQAPGQFGQAPQQGYVSPQGQQFGGPPGSPFGRPQPGPSAPRPNPGFGAPQQTPGAPRPNGPGPNPGYGAPQQQQRPSQPFAPQQGPYPGQQGPGAQPNPGQSPYPPNPFR
ncbi:trypsin-like serine protease [Gordonia sp. TBRC 11910]|uniref:Trypsin-like serine protease n=1 Tax=Gordonia asplenii TaxID=2725283 RepID=A0A848KSG0_9ACTN|nr:trypsin-like peptidase domain-containing protein [Gordonia asplenii]NMO01202.1 trypsin-like serine protease [Gordonia asplenii]